MNKNLIVDYFSCILFKIAGPIIRILPKGFALFIGRLLGRLFYCFDLKHRAMVYSNIKTALAGKVSLKKLDEITRDCYKNFGQNIIEILFIPSIDKRYIKKYIKVEGWENITEAFNQKKGVIFLVMHEGNWELSNIICANMGFPFVLFVRDQKFPRLNALLNSYRVQKGCKIIQRQSSLPNGLAANPLGSEQRQNEFYGIRKLIESLKNNEAIGMTADQGGKSGVLVDFFGRQASMPMGAVRFALKYGAVILPSFFIRVNGLRHKVIISPPFRLEMTGSLEKDIKSNLQSLIKIYEKYIAAYPGEYLWLYKIWKYGHSREIIILDDGKTGHLRQSQTLAKITKDYLEEKGKKASLRIIEVKLKNRFFKLILPIAGSLIYKYDYKAYNWLLKISLVKESYQALVFASSDIVISCGSSLSGLNYLFSKINRTKSLTIMRPYLVNTDKFDLVAIPHHDGPAQKKNIVKTEGALNLVDDEYLKIQKQRLLNTYDLRLTTYNFYIGLLIGGDTKDFHLSIGLMKAIIEQVKCFSEKEKAGVLITTSRRTPAEVEALIKKEFKDYSYCPFLVIANEENPDYALGGILGFAQAVIVSPESISMVSEAVSAPGHTIVFDAQVGQRHRKFLKYLSEKRYIHLAVPEEISGVINKIYTEQPRKNILRDREKVKQALIKVI
ncbi:MAG: ELM1/GtrOC1 family putative glycosyltransferase [Candidatus Omnitrophota bacterium]